ncbi:ThiF family adenylyltransferase [Streptomyces sp. NPDC090306]|uniref:ThiF family adenylyltransferase n=1 Tax=Streptomyces sp. NPDC090306 TaxID=3365961 RepID=UPI00382F4524
MPAERAGLDALLASGCVRFVHDRLDEQLDELASCLVPSGDPAALAAARRDALGDVPVERYGTWAWYPWSGRLVRVLPEEPFRLVRTDRNRGRISRAEQERLRGCRIGVVGLSVGNGAALACAMEGLAGSFRLADFDRVGLSNLNRLRAGVHELGVEKTVLCARQMYETDPYLDVELLRGGVTEDSVDALFGGAGPDAPAGAGGLDLLVEECDTPWVKFAVREHARRLGVPVLMEMNDRGMLDVERFDLEPERPVFHGRAGATTADDLRDLDRAGLLACLLRVVDERALSPAMTAALPEIGRTLSSWPQLASGVALGSALVADTARRVLLGHPVPSGRFYADLSEIVGGGAQGRPCAGPGAAPKAEAEAPTPAPSAPGEPTPVTPAFAEGGGRR